MKTMRSLADDFVRQRRGKRTAEYESSTKSGLNFFVKFLESQNVVSPADLRREHITRWLVHASARPHYRTGMPRSAITIHSEKNRVRTFLRTLIDQWLLAPSILDVFPQLRKPPLVPRPALKHADVTRVIGAVPQHSPCLHMLRTLVEVAYSTALRPCELLRLNVIDIRFEQGLVRVMGKGEKERVIPIGKHASRELERYVHAVRPLLHREPHETALWLNSRGGRLSYTRLLALLHKHQPRTGGRFVTWYSFRRACATELARSGASLWAIKEILGHEHLDTLKHYVNFSLEDLQRAHARCHPRNRPSSEVEED